MRRRVRRSAGRSASRAHRCTCDGGKEEEVKFPTITYVAHRNGKVSRRVILNRARAVKVALDYIPDDGREYFIVFLLTGAGHILGVHVVSIGTAEWCDSRPVEVFRVALLTPGCSRIVAVHNHPHGGTRLSKMDKRMSKELRKAGALLGIEVADYLVVSHHMPGSGERGYASAWK